MTFVCPIILNVNNIKLVTLLVNVPTHFQMSLHKNTLYNSIPTHIYNGQA